MTSKVRRFQVATAYRKYTISCMGDSLTWTQPPSDPANPALTTPSGVQCPQDYWPEVLANLLRTRYGALVKARNFGISGTSTRHMYLRRRSLLHYDTPDLVCIWGGTNDAGDSIPATGGTTAVPTSTQTYIQAMIELVMQAAESVGKPQRVVVVGQHFLNYASGGDNVASATPVSSTTAGVIAAQQAAVATFANDARGKVIFSDTFNYVRGVLNAATPSTTPDVNTIVGNKVTLLFPEYAIAPVELSASQYPMRAEPTTYTLAPNANSSPIAPHGWGIMLASTANLHYNELGNFLVAESILASIVAQAPSWITELSL